MGKQNDECDSMTKKDIYDFLKKEKKNNKNKKILLTGSKEFLCDQFKTFEQPNSKKTSQQPNSTKISEQKGTSKELNMVNQWLKQMRSVTEIRDFTLKVKDLGDAEIKVFMKKNKIPTEKTIFNMFEKKEPMKKILAKINKIDDKVDREEVGLYAIESENFGDYSSPERRKFFTSFGRDIEEECFD